MRVNELHNLRNLFVNNDMRVFKCQALFLRHGKTDRITEFWLPVSFFVYPRDRKRASEYSIFVFRFPTSLIKNGILTSIFVSRFSTTLDNRILVVISVFRFCRGPFTQANFVALKLHHVSDMSLSAIFLLKKVIAMNSFSWRSRTVTEFCTVVC